MHEFELIVKVIATYCPLVPNIPPPVELRPNAGHGLLILEVSRPHTTTHHIQQDFSGRVISPAGFEPTIPASEWP